MFPRSADKKMRRRLPRRRLVIRSTPVSLRFRASRSYPFRAIAKPRVSLRGHHRAHPEVLRHPFGLELLGPADVEVLGRELLAGLGRDEHLARARRRAHARGDVDVDTEVVAADAPRPARVHAGAHPRAGALVDDLLPPALRLERRSDPPPPARAGPHDAAPTPLHARSLAP